MVKFECLNCEFVTDKKSTYNNHRKSKKHIENRKNDPIKTKCDLCHKEFTTQSNCSRHYKACKGKHQNDENSHIYKNTIRILEDQLKAKDKTMSQMMTGNQKNLDEDRKLLKAVINSAGNSIKQSMSALSYVICNYNEAPTITYIDSEASIINKNKKYKDPILFVQDMIHYHTHKKLHRLFSEIIFNEYKKNNPKEQAIWSSDVSRLSYIVNEMSNDKSDETGWIVDKKGVKTKKYVIGPLLKYSKKLLTEYIANRREFIKGCTTSSTIFEVSERMRVASNIITDIDSHVIENALVRFMAPRFKIDLPLNVDD